jgi:hypothetical protein
MLHKKTEVDSVPDVFSPGTYKDFPGCPCGHFHFPFVAQIVQHSPFFAT